MKLRASRACFIAPQPRSIPAKTVAGRNALVVKFARSVACALSLVVVGAPAVARSHATANAVMYVSDQRTGAIAVVSLADGRLLREIPYPLALGGVRFSGGAGLAVDAHGDLYAAYGFDDGRNYPGKTVIFEYAPGGAQRLEALEGWCCAAPQIALSKAGELAEAQPYLPPYGGGGVGFIEPGERRVGPVNLALAGALFDAYDSKGTLWLSGVDEEFHPHFGFIRHHSNAFQEIYLNPVPPAGPIAVDAAGNLLIESDGGVYWYDVLAGIVYHIPMRGDPGVTAMALSQDGATLYLARQNGTVTAHRFPAGGDAYATYRVGGLPFAIALGTI